MQTEEIVAGLVVLDVVRIKGENITMTPDELRATIMEALNLANEKEIPYATNSGRQNLHAPI